jgi:hypothetical protein
VYAEFNSADSGNTDGDKGEEDLMDDTEGEEDLMDTALDTLTRSGKADGGSAETEVPAKKADGGSVEAEVQRPKTYQDHQDRDHQDRSPCMFLYLKVNWPRAGLRIGPRGRKNPFSTQQNAA